MMHLPPQQREDIRAAEAAGARGATIDFTAEQKKEWMQAVQDELAAKQDNLHHFRKIAEAAQQPGFFGDVRRAITASRRSLDELAAGIGVAPRLLSDFRAGDADLPAAALERLFHLLGLRLMQEIPH